MSPSSCEATSFFKSVDTNGKGSITKQEMRNALLCLNRRQTDERGEKGSGDITGHVADLQNAVDHFLESFNDPILKDDLVRALPDVPDRRDHKVFVKAPIWRKMQAIFSLYGQQLSVVLTILLVQVGCGAWQALKILEDDNAYRVFGYGVVVAKGFAGALYPTMAILLLSSSRRTQTLLRSSTLVQRLPLWDSGTFIHVWTATSAVLFGTCHAIAHMLGTFSHGSRILSQETVPEILGGQAWSYSQFLCCVSGITGLALLVLFWTIALAAVPIIRRCYFQVFRWAHRLVLPLIILLCIHGSSSILQRPIMGYWIAVPTMIVLYEKMCRTRDAFVSVPATLEVIGNMVRVTCFQVPDQRWRATPGQYAQLQVPSVSRIQWHPFTISGSMVGSIEMHVKCVGPWTRSLRESANRSKTQTVRLSGPFGAPAQRYLQYPYSIMIGCGIGITPPNAILTSITKAEGVSSEYLSSTSSTGQLGQYSSTTALRHVVSPQASDSSISIVHATQWTTRLQHENDMRFDNRPPMLPGSRVSDVPTETPANMRDEKLGWPEHISERSKVDIQRMDFHFVVRNLQDLAPFSDLRRLVRTSNSQMSGCDPGLRRLSMHLTGATTVRDKILRRIKQQYMTTSHPCPSEAFQQHYGRPDLEALLRNHFIELVERRVDRVDVGVFYCGPKAACGNLSRCCNELTAQAMHLNLRIRYVLWAEQF